MVKAAESIERACAVLGRGLSGFVELAGSITRLGAALETTQRMGHELAVRQRKTSANTATALEELRAMRQPKG